MVKRIIVVALMLMMSLSAPVLAAEPGTGVIEGQLVNRTLGGGSVAAVPLSLTIYLNGAVADSVAAETDAGGNFVFAGLATAAGYEYQVTAYFQYAEYRSEIISFGEGEETGPITIPVFDATRSEESIRVVMSHTIVYIDPGSLLVKEYQLLVNDSDRTYVGAGPEGNDGTLRFFLPADAVEFQPAPGLMESGIIESEGGFAESVPLLPGMKEVTYSYRIPYESGEYTLSKGFDYPVDVWNLLVRGEEVQVTVGRLFTETPLEVQGERFQHFSGADFSPGTIEVKLSGLPKAGGGNPFRWAALVLLAAAVLVAGWYFFRKRGRPAVAADYEDSKQRLLRELAYLDDSFEMGTIDEEDYRRQRAEKKQRLMELLSSEDKGKR